MVRSNHQIKMGRPAGLAAIITITISTLATLSGAVYSTGSQGVNQQALYDYYLQAIADPSSYKAQASLDRPLTFDDSLAYKLEDEPSRYLNPSGGSSSVPLDLLDVQKLVAYLKQLQQQQQQQEDEDSSNNDNVVSDINSHLPPSDPTASLISGPVNDPADFEATISQLTNAINHEIPNSHNRSEILDNLLSVFLGSIMQQLKQQQQQLPPQDDHLNSINSQLLTSAGEDSLVSTTESEASSIPSASRYGGSEYIDHPLALVGHQYVQGGAGEGRQLLGPDGTFENVQVIKSDHAVPSYCNPPNPCPIGYTAEDGCLEKFVNSASFSREYQINQQCECDNEHSLFNCASPVSSIKSPMYSLGGADGSQQQGADGDSHQLNAAAGEEQEVKLQLATNRLDTLARTIQNRFGGLEGVKNLIDKQEHATTSAKNDNEDEDDEHYSTIVKKGSHIGADFKY